MKHSSIAELHYLQSERDLVDIWCIRNLSVERFTYQQHKPLIQRRLDYFFISYYLQDYAKHTDIIPAVLTDHSAIILKLSGSEGSQRGHSYWKFKNSLLTDNVYVGLMREKIEEFLAVNYFPDDSCLGWEFLKYKIKEFTRKYSINKKATENVVRINLESKLKILSNSLSLGCADEIVGEYEDCKTRLESLSDNVTNGLIVRSRVTWYEKEEKSNNISSFIILRKETKPKHM